MLGAVYLALVPLLSYLSGNRDSIVALFAMCFVILVDLIITDMFKATLGSFFLFRAIVDLTLLILISKLPLLSIKRYLVSYIIFTSLVINIYLCFELGNVFVYRQWETINLILCEWIFLTLIISDRSWLMFASTKAYIYGALAAVGLFLVGMLKYRTVQKESLEKELKTTKQNIIVLEKVNEDNKAIDKAVTEVKAEAQVIQNEINQKRANKTKPAVGTPFGDRRL